MNTIPDNLFILEMANNHMGDLSHGINVIREFGKVCREFPQFKFAFKLQYRDLDTFIHPSMKNRVDIKHIKRFLETKLTRKEFDTLITEIRAEGFLSMATPFDNKSINTIIEQKLDIIKIASCSFTDWPLLEEVVKAKLPIIASTAGAKIEDIDRVVSFINHRVKDFAILHCVGEYPTPDEKMHLGQIDYLRSRYPNIKIGFSTHENPDNSDIVRIAIAKRAKIFEKHVGLETEKYHLNPYSANPTQLRSWLNAASNALAICGITSTRLPVNPIEASSLQSLRRGIFANRDIKLGQILKDKDIYFAFPPIEGQFTANDWSKYAVFQTTEPIVKDQPLLINNTKRDDTRSKIWSITERVKKIIADSNITLPSGLGLEISHHYGIDQFEKYGLSMITIVNRGYCKKLLVSLPGQTHPEQYHKLKEETFHILYGEINLSLNGKDKTYKQGDVINIEPEVRHSFFSPNGSIIEEISSTHFKEDSYYTDTSINSNSNRKTYLSFWLG